jgi:hypothetical protein
LHPKAFWSDQISKECGQSSVNLLVMYILWAWLVSNLNADVQS